MSTAIYGKVTGVKEMLGTQMTRIWVEIPIEQFVAAINAVHNREVLITLAPPMGGGYGVMESRPAPPKSLPAERLAEQSDITVPAGFAAAMGVEPVNAKVNTPEPAVNSEVKTKPDNHEQTLSRWCAIRCKEVEFQTFLKETFQGAADLAKDQDPEGQARAIVLQVCTIKSRAELDTDERGARMFHVRIREPFAEWSRG